MADSGDSTCWRLRNSVSTAEVWAGSHSHWIGINVVEWPIAGKITGNKWEKYLEWSIAKTRREEILKLPG